jgi:uncharacterized protein (TIGR03086 family)
MIREQEAAIKAARLFKDIINNVDDSKFGETMPPDFKKYDPAPTTLREILNYHAYDDAWIPDMLAGRTMAEVGEDKWKGDLLGDDPKASYAHFNETACTAIEKLDDPERTVHCSFGDFSAANFLRQVLGFRGMRAYDVAKAFGLNTDLPDDLVEDMLALLVPEAEEWRKYGVWGPALPIPEDATPQQRLLATLGYE